MKKKVSLLISLVFAFVLLFNNIYAVSIWDTKTLSTMYKVSEDTSEFKLPFVRVTTQRVEMDKELSQSGIICSTSTIDINSKMDGNLLICNQDTIRINSDINSAVICTTGDTVINANVNNAIIFCTGTVTLGENSNVKENLTIYASDLIVNGNIDGNILGSTVSAKINNNIKGELRLDTDSIEFSENGKVEQGIYINTSNTDLKVDESVGTATIDIVEEEKITIKDYAMEIFSAGITNFVLFLIILLFIKKDGLSKLLNKIEQSNALSNGLKGYVAIIGAICLGIIFLMLAPSVGIAAIVFAAAILVCLSLIKNIIVGTFIVQLVDKKYENVDKTAIRPNNILVAIITFILLELLEKIPYVGVVISFIVFIISLGVCISLIIPKKKKEDNNEPETTVAK